MEDQQESARRLKLLESAVLRETGQRLSDGWRCVSVQRKSGKTAGGRDWYYYSPVERKYRSVREVVDAHRSAAAPQAAAPQATTDNENVEDTNCELGGTSDSGHRIAQPDFPTVADITGAAGPSATMETPLRSMNRAAHIELGLHVPPVPWGGNVDYSNKATRRHERSRVD